MSIADTSSLLAELKLAHLVEVLASEPIESLVEAYQDSRPKCLAHLKTLGVSKLTERQALTNALGKALREDRIGTASSTDGVSQASSNGNNGSSSNGNNSSSSNGNNGSSGTPAAARSTPVPAAGAAPGPSIARVTRLYAVSDIHWDFPENRGWLQNVADGAHKDDAVVLVGDITHKCELFEDCLRTFTRKFGVVIFVPGNHDLWIRPDVGAEFRTSIEKLEWCLAACNRLGVRTDPTRIEGTGGAVWVVPLFSWYHHLFDGH
jgi:3',5'-cyclic AMP phosphodiesterase CpdA